jgi:uncharacterized repeat protein (TIGR02543 family)
LKFLGKYVKLSLRISTMKKLFFITAVLITLLTACPTGRGGDDPDPSGPSTEDGKTTIVFDNTQGTCAITVYSSYMRGEGNYITQVSAASVSEVIDWPIDGTTTFYFTFQINFLGIDDFTIDYVSEITGKDQKQVRIDAKVRNTIPLPTLAEALPLSLDTFISNKSHLFIRNNTSYSLQLLRGTSIIPPDNVSETVVNSQERPQYTIDPAPVSSYRLLGGSVNSIPFPDSLVNFEAGRAYNLSFSNDTLSLIPPGIIELKPENIAGLSLGKARVIYYWINDNLETTATATITPATLDVIITPQGTGYVVKQWYVDGINTGLSGATYVFKNATIGEHTVDLFVEKDGKIYNTSITITVGTPYTVTFDANGATDGTAPDAQADKLKDSSITLPDGDGLTKSGYIFGGWNTNASGTGTNYDAGSSYTVPGDVILYARWNEAYAITFNNNGGSGTVATQIVAKGSSVTLPGGSGLARTGYTFGGWNINDSGTGANYGIGSSYTPAADVTLYAMWFPNSATSLTAGTSWTNGSITSTASGSAVWYSFNVVLGNTYSVWWNDRFRSDGTKNLDVKVSAYYSSGAIIFTEIDDGFSIPQEFTAAEAGTVRIKVVRVVDNVGETFAVRYTSNATITFDANGATDGTAPSAQTVSVGSSITLPAQGSLARTGYTFGGWNTNSSGTGTNYNSGASYTVNSSTTLYARWVGGSSSNEANPIPLTAGVWTDGSITSTAGAAWYSFYATSGSTYYIWWNDSYEGNSTKTLDVKVSAYNVSGTGIFTGQDSGWSSYKSFTAGSSGTVKIKVEPYSSGQTGTFAVAYSTGSARPTTTGTPVTPSTRTVTISMFDSYGDGWDGSGALRINKNGVQLAASVKVSSGYSGTYTFSVSSGDLIQIYWVAGSGQGENSFIVYYADASPSPAFTSSNNDTWSGTNALVYRTRGSMTNISGGTLLGSFTVP